MSRTKGLLVAALMIFGAATTSHAEDPCAGVDRLESLRTVYYKGGEKPPDPSAAELATLRQLKALPELREQAAFLEDALPGDESLQAIAIRDHDGDGIKDYRINSCGEFRENDPNVDCDEVANVLDDSPYDSATTPGSACGGEPDWHEITNDNNANGVPDHIDWRLSPPSGDDAARAAEVQEDLYRDYRIVLVDRRARMPAAMAIELDQVIREIYREQVTPDFPPLRVIATDLPVCPEDSDYGWASPENATVNFAPDTLALIPILRLEILVHEIAHAVQFNRDFSPEDLLGFRTRNRFDSDGFHEFARLLGWEAVPDSSQVPLLPYRLAVRNCDEYDYPFELKYLGREGKHWKDDWAIFTDAERKTHHMVDSYAFTDAWEWDAEYRAAFVLNQLVRAAGRLCTPGEAKELHQRLNDDIAAAWRYHHENAIGLPSYEGALTDQFHVDDDTWDALARLFLLPSYPDVCSE
ncbi:MAG: hypothetical protein L0210_00155 [Rhodospirillales bacterium]|nr:hypothetical protein [Rhodospirillales bacterium]